MATFIGSGWETKYGVNLSLKKSELDNLPTDKYGNIFVAVSKRKEQDEKSKATHYVKVDDYRYEKLGVKTDDGF